MIEYLIERIKKDAAAESKKILGDAKKLAQSNIEYAQKHADEQLSVARKAAHATSEREAENALVASALAERLEVLRQKTAIVASVFDGAFERIKFNWRTEKQPTYELRLTKEALRDSLRGEIENDVVEILFA